MISPISWRDIHSDIKKLSDDDFIQCFKGSVF
jgi:hypothetical protein